MPRPSAPNPYLPEPSWGARFEALPVEVEGAWLRICRHLQDHSQDGGLERTLAEWARVLHEGTGRTLAILRTLQAAGIASIPGTLAGDVPPGLITIQAPAIAQRNQERKRERDRKRRQRQAAREGVGQPRDNRWDRGGDNPGTPSATTQDASLFDGGTGGGTKGGTEPGQAGGQQKDLRFNSSKAFQEKTKNPGREERQEPESLAFMIFPRRSGDHYVLTQADHDRLCARFPSLDVAAELRRALAWCEQAAKNRKSDVPKFLGNWLIRADKERASERPAGPRTKTSSVFDHPLGPIGDQR